MYIRSNICSIEGADLEGDSIGEFKDFLSQEGDDKDIIVDDPDEEDNDDKEDEKENDDADEDEDEEGKKGKKTDDEESGKGKVEVPHFHAINKKYPNFFKDFPHVRHVIAHEKEYRELFPSVEEAKETVEQLENFSSLQESLSSGKPEDIVNVLESISELGDDVISNFASNFLGGIKKVDQNLYFEVITPELVNMVKNTFNAGVRNENENLQAAAKVIALHLFGNMDVATGKAEVKIPSKSANKDEGLEREKKQFKSERYTTLYNDVVSDSNDKLDAMILDGFDTEKKLSKGMRDVIVEKTRKQISEILSADKVHSSRMTSLWRKAEASNYASSNKTKIISTYLGSAKDLIPKIRSKVRSEILGTRDRSSENSSNRDKSGRKDRVEPPNNVGGGRTRQPSGKSLDPKSINWRKTSDLDILNDRATLKS